MALPTSGHCWCAALAVQMWHSIWPSPDLSLQWNHPPWVEVFQDQSHLWVIEFKGYLYYIYICILYIYTIYIYIQYIYIYTIYIYIQYIYIYIQYIYIQYIYIQYNIYIHTVLYTCMCVLQYVRWLGKVLQVPMAVILIANDTKACKECEYMWTSHFKTWWWPDDPMTKLPNTKIL